MKTDKPSAPIHPGVHIKQSVLPAKLSIKRAAEMIGVGRPALSNLLNGKASLSAEMAMRIEKAFQASAADLLKMQARYDEFESRERQGEIVVRAFAPAYLQISARQIAAWSETISARAELPALLRILIHTTASNLSKVDFPAFDNSQRKGWDGQVISDSVTPWIPRGTSGWEFGCDRDARRKVESDYQSRTSMVTAEERKNVAFVAVTPTNWAEKEQWAASKRSLQEWRDVRAFDASDLEQWLEQSIPGQIRFKELLGAGTHDTRSLDQIWLEWATVTEPELNKHLFYPAAERHQGKLADWLKEAPSRPFVISADSSLEALAFLACALDRFRDASANIYDRAIVIRSSNALNSITRVSSNFVAIVASAEAEQALVGLYKKTHTIVIRGRNSVIGGCDIALDLVGHEDFRKALHLMGLSDQRIDQLARESARSPTILRRRLAQVQAVKVPPWAGAQAVARSLVPLVLVGVWDSSVNADREILQCLTDNRYGEVERAVAGLAAMDEPPVWSVGNLRGVVSKIDAMYAVHGSITRDDLENFLFAAEVVLSEDDPALDLPEDKRWAANLYGKSRDHSSALRQGVCDTLVLMAVHGNALFSERLGFDLEVRVSLVVRKLLTPSSASKWLSQRSDLPRYAEAAPDEFLTVLESDLKSHDPKIATLLKPTSSGIFGDCPRTGLLWALELLAWKPERLLRVASILGQLCGWKVDDNWANKPLRTLESLLRCWMPQTTASVDERNRVLEALCKKSPEVGWALCVSQFDPGLTTGHYNYRPHWRADAHEAGDVVSVALRWEAQRKAIELALNWPSHDERTLGDLVERLGGLSPEHRTAVWNLISAWSRTAPSDSQKAALREQIRRCALTRRSRRRNLDEASRKRARTAYTLLESEDPVVRHGWLFLRRWVEESADELEDDNLDLRTREERIALQRRVALREVFEQTGLEGIKRLCKSGEASSVVGWHMAENTTGSEAATRIVEALLLDQSEDIQDKLDDCVAGFLRALSQPERCSVVSDALDHLRDADGPRVRLLKCAPFGDETWRHADKIPQNLQTRYWQEVHPRLSQHNAAEMARSVDELLTVGRPRAAFFAATADWSLLDTPRLKRVLTDVATKNSERAGHYRLDGHDISEAFDDLDKRGDSSRAELARLEFMFIDALDHSEHGIRNLEAELSETPSFFIQALALAFKRTDGGEDPPGWQLSNPDQRVVVATAAYSMLTTASRVPGTQADGSIDIEKLRAWLEQVRSLCLEHGRADIGDQMIGQLLSHAPAGKDGVWPCEPVREVVEDISSNEIAKGMNVGVRNSPGASWRGEGGAQEREQSAKYRGWSRQVAFEWPFVSNLLERIARSYDDDARWWDAQASVRQRLGA